MSSPTGITFSLLMEVDDFVADAAAIFTDGAHASLGSGRLIAPGLILTARHVVGVAAENGWRLRLLGDRLSDGSWRQTYEASVVWRAVAPLDLALLRIEGLHPVPRLTSIFSAHTLLEHIEVTATGCPEARWHDRRELRDYTVSGRLANAERFGPHDWIIDRASTPDQPGTWAGMSGAVVAREGPARHLHLFGVVQEVPANFSHGLLKVARLAAAFNDAAFVARLTEALGREARLSPWQAGGAARQTRPPGIDTSRLPPPLTEHFVGRADALHELDAGWANAETGIVVLVGPHGAGKSTLIDRWLRALQRDRYRGAEEVYAWSFHNQGGGNRMISAADFIQSTLRRLGDPDPTEGDALDQAERLAGLLRTRRTLLILDGLEALQNPPGEREWRINDEPLQRLLRRLAGEIDHHGLCVISTRYPVLDLKPFAQISVKFVELDRLGVADGVQLLKVMEVVGDDSELARSVDELDGSALLLSLLGSYLTASSQGDIKKRPPVGELVGEDRLGSYLDTIVKSYETWLGPGAAVAAWRLLGFFDRPAGLDVLDALRTGAPIARVNNRLRGLSPQAWQTVLNRLQRGHLLTIKDGMVATHATFRSFFAKRLKQRHPAAWDAGHSRLYHHFLCLADKTQLERPEDVGHLVMATYHGCQAGRHEEVFAEICSRPAYGELGDILVTRFGQTTTHMELLSNFFRVFGRYDQTYLQSRPASGLVLFKTGGCLQSLGRFDAAIGPMQAGLQARIEAGEWTAASHSAFDLSCLHRLRNQPESRRYAGIGRNLARKTKEPLHMILNIANVARVMTLDGQLTQAKKYFALAEKWQNKHHPEVPCEYLYHIHGFWYCDLLLEMGQSKEVLKRVQVTLPEMRTKKWSLAIGLELLSDGRARAMAGSDQAAALRALDEGVDVLRRAGHRDSLPLGLLARAETYLRFDDPVQAAGDLKEASDIAGEHGMFLYEAECRLLNARRLAKTGDNAGAAVELQAFDEVSRKLGYHRRTQAAARLRGALNAG